MVIPTPRFVVMLTGETCLLLTSVVAGTFMQVEALAVQIRGVPPPSLPVRARATVQLHHRLLDQRRRTQIPVYRLARRHAVLLQRAFNQCCHDLLW